MTCKNIKRKLINLLIVFILAMILPISIYASDQSPNIETIDTETTITEQSSVDASDSGTEDTSDQVQDSSRLEESEDLNQEKTENLDQEETEDLGQANPSLEQENKQEEDIDANPTDENQIMEEEIDENQIIEEEIDDNQITEEEIDENLETDQLEILEASNLVEDEETLTNDTSNDEEEQNSLMVSEDLPQTRQMSTGQEQNSQASTGESFEYENEDTSLKILGFKPGRETINVWIPDLYEGNPITSIGDWAFSGLNIENLVLGKNIEEIGNHAFSNNKIKDLDTKNTVKIGENAFASNEIKNLEVGESLKRVEAKAFIDNEIEKLDTKNINHIGNYSFAANEIKDLKIGDSLKKVSDNAFRDNQIKSLSTNQVEVIGKNAFANNQLENLDFGNIKIIDDGAFRYNDLERVHIPKSIEKIGDQVFANNEKFVIVETESDLPKSDYNEENFGHVVNPATVKVNFINKDTGQEIISSKILGRDLTSINHIIEPNKEKTIEPPAIAGYKALEDSISFIPNDSEYTIDIVYEYMGYEPLIEVIKSPLVDPGDYTLSEEDLLTYVRAEDAYGKDITSNIKLELEKIDANIPGPVKIIYSVKDNLENQASKVVDFFVGTDWMKFPIGNGWVLEDFTYNQEDKNKVIGFSETGLEKVKSEKNLILPHINPYDGLTTIDTVDYNFVGYNSFRNRGLESLTDYKDNIVRIEGYYDPRSSLNRHKGAFQNNELTNVKLNNLEYMGSYAFRDNKLRKVNFPELRYIGEIALSSNQIEEINEEDLPKVEYIGMSGLASNKDLRKIYMPALKELGTAVSLFDKNISDVYFPSLEIVGPNAFASNKITKIDETNFPKLKHIAGSSFRNNPIERIYIPNVQYIGNASDSNNANWNSVVKGPDNKVDIPEGAFASLEYVGSYGLYNLGHDEFYIPNLSYASPNAFLDNPGNPEYFNKVVIWTNNENVPSKSNYLINPIKDIEGPFNEDDFIWDQNNTNKVNGFSSSGIIKYLDESNQGHISFPDRAQVIGVDAFEYLNINSIQGKSIQNLDYGAFYYNNLSEETIDLPNLESIGEWALARNKIIKADFPRLKYVGSRGLSNNNMVEVDLPELIKVDFRSFDLNPIESLNAPKLEEIGAAAFGSHNLKELDLPSAKSIGVSAFAKSDGGTYIWIGNQSETEKLLYGFKSRGELPLEKINLPQVEEIQPYAFYDNKINEINLPRVKTIGKSAFSKNNLEKINLDQVVTIEDMGFSDNQIKDAYLSLDTEDLRNNAFLSSEIDPTRVFIPEYRNPHNLEDGIVGGVRHHVINPTKVTVVYRDEHDRDLAESFSEYILEDKTYYPIRIFDYEVSPKSYHQEDNRQENLIEFIYTNLGIKDKQTQGVEIRQGYERDINTGLNKHNYYIGSTMVTNVYVDVTGMDNNIINPSLRIYYDPKYMDTEAISIPTNASSIKGTQIL